MMPGKRSSRRRRRVRCGNEVEECEAFLTGHLAEAMVRRGEYVRPWIWINLLAHGSERELRELGGLGGRREQERWSRTAAGPVGPATSWRDARSYLAGEVLELADACCSLGEVQRSTIIPLELDLASRTELAWWRPHEWVIVVEAALSNHCRNHHR